MFLDKLSLVIFEQEYDRGYDEQPLRTPLLHKNDLNDIVDCFRGSYSSNKPVVLVNNKKFTPASDVYVCFR